MLEYIYVYVYTCRIRIYIKDLIYSIPLPVLFPFPPRWLQQHCYTPSFTLAYLHTPPHSSRSDPFKPSGKRPKSDNRLHTRPVRSSLSSLGDPSSPLPFQPHSRHSPSLLGAFALASPLACAWEALSPNIHGWPPYLKLHLDFPSTLLPSIALPLLTPCIIYVLIIFMVYQLFPASRIWAGFVDQEPLLRFHGVLGLMFHRHHLKL